MVELDGDAVAFDMLLHPGHQVRALQPLDIPRPVVDIGGQHQLAALLHAGDEEQVEVGPGGVDGGGITRRAGSEDD